MIIYSKIADYNMEGKVWYGSQAKIRTMSFHPVFLAEIDYIRTVPVYPFHSKVKYLNSILIGGFLKAKFRPSLGFVVVRQRQNRFI